MALSCLQPQVADQTIPTTQKKIPGAGIVIGSAHYEVNSLLAASMAHEYVLGFGFQLVYNAQLKFRDAILTIGVEEGTTVSETQNPSYPYDNTRSLHCLLCGYRLVSHLYCKRLQVMHGGKFGDVWPVTCKSFSQKSCIYYNLSFWSAE